MTPWYLYWPLVAFSAVGLLLAIGLLQFFAWVAAVEIYTHFVLWRRSRIRPALSPFVW